MNVFVEHEEQSIEKTEKTFNYTIKYSDYDYYFFFV